MSHRRAVLAAVLVCGALGIAAARAWPGVRREVDHLRRLGGGSVRGVTCLPRPAREEVELTASGLRLRGDLYRPAGPAIGGVVLLHGSSVHGRRLPLYPALANELTRQGHAVLAVDLRGFGESDDPVPLDDPASWDFAADAIAAVDSLLAWVPVPGNQVHVVGHSFGAGPGLAAAQRDPRIAKVVLIGPTRRIGERFLAAGAPDSAYYVERWQRDMRLPAPVPHPVMAAVLHPLNIENYAAGGPYAPRVPVLFTDGELETRADLDSLRALAARMAPPATYWTTPGTDHYLHTARLLREPHRWAPERLASVSCYNTGVVRDFVSVVSAWLRTGASPPAAARAAT